MKKAILLLIGACLRVATAHADDSSQAINLRLFRISSEGAGQIRRTLDVETGQTGISIRFQAAKEGLKHPRVSLELRREENWSGYSFLSFWVTNKSDQKNGFCVGINQDALGRKEDAYLAGCTQFLPGEKARLLVPLNTGGGWALEGKWREDLIPRKWKDSLRLNSIRSISLIADEPAKPVLFQFSGFELQKDVSFDGLVDEFGQNSSMEWPGKVRSIDEMKSLRGEQEKSLGDWPETWSRFGGDSKGRKSEAAGHFRVERNGGRWQMIDPEGWPFFSIGMNSLSQDGWTSVENRQNLFQKIPDDAVILERHGKKSVNFYAENLKKLGVDQTAWSRLTTRRLRSWGFNTIGSWRGEEFRADPPLPYTEIVYVTPKTTGGAVPAYWVGPQLVTDYFDDRFAAEVERELGSPALAARDADPWFIGVFVDNEIKWSGGQAENQMALPRAILMLPESAAAKRAALEVLKKRYAGMEELNRAWQTHLDAKDFEGLRAMKLELPEKLNEKAREDLKEIHVQYARRYFEAVAKAVRKNLPHKLYLGCRFEKHSSPFYIIEEAARSVDVLSINRYDAALDPKEWSVLERLQKPVMFTEFHFGARDRGAPQGALQTVKDQKARAESYRRYAASARALPQCVGLHWFQYLDQPVTGRSLDGENYNCGFVTVTDTVHTELAQSASDWNRGVYGASAISEIWDPGVRAENQ